MLLLIGESGSGKTTILNELIKKGFKQATNHTTRPKREGEGDEYQFVTKEEFERLWQEGELLQRSEFNGEFYGISTTSLKEEVVAIQIVDSIKDVKARAQELGLGDMKMKTFYIYVPAEERTKRMLERGDSIESIQKRLEIDKEKFKNVKEVADYIIENKEIEEAVEEIIKLYKN